MDLPRIARLLFAATLVAAGLFLTLLAGSSRAATVNGYAPPAEARELTKEHLNAGAAVVGSVLAVGSARARTG